MNLIHLEDDPLYAEYIHLELKDFAKKDKVDLSINHIRTERQFIERLDTLLVQGDAFLLDVMVRWSFPEDDDGESIIKEPPGEYYDAGLRCAKLLLEKLPNDQPRIILLYTVYQREELKEEISQLNKVKSIHSLEILTKTEDVEEAWKLLNRSTLK